jgi:hypothetical protein
LYKIMNDSFCTRTFAPFIIVAQIVMVKDFVMILRVANIMAEFF